MNENGYSLVETILGIVILMMLCGTIIPISYTMKTNLYQKKLEMYAAETAYEGMKKSYHQGMNEGSKIIENVTYDWHFDGEKICVSFFNLNNKQMICINDHGKVL